MTGTNNIVELIIEEGVRLNGRIHKDDVLAEIERRVPAEQLEEISQGGK